VASKQTRDQMYRTFHHLAELFQIQFTTVEGANKPNIQHHTQKVPKYTKQFSQVYEGLKKH
jgi:hypothetical protein